MRSVCSMSLLAGMTLLGAACGSVEDVDAGATPLSWEEFRARAIQDEGDVFVFNGDEAVEGERGLRAYYDEYVGGGDVGTWRDHLQVYNTGYDIKWSATQARNLTYCVSSASFGSRYSTVVNAMATAAASWEAVANVNYVHAMSYDSDCTAAQTGVLFDVRQVTGMGYVARAFYPNASRSARNLLIDSSAFGGTGTLTLAGILRHELGHTLGFRHESPQYPPAGCVADNNYRALTPYDPSSIMTTPACGGQVNNALSTLDRQGAAALYP